MLTITEAKAGNKVVLVKWRQALPNDGDGHLVGVCLRPNGMQALPAEGSPAWKSKREE